MSLGTFFPDVLADLKFPQAVDHHRANDQAGEQSGQAGKSSAKREVAENSEWREIMKELDEQQPVKQSSSRTGRRSLVVSRWRTNDPLAANFSPLLERLLQF